MMTAVFTEADRRAYQIAARQDRVVTRRQLLGAGMSVDQIQARRSSGAWRSLARGVYLIGPGAPTYRQCLRAAILTLPGAVASHGAAAELLGIARIGRGRVVVTVPSTSHHASPLAQVHRSRTLTPADVLEMDGLLVTCRSRTLIDLAATLPPVLMARIVDEQLARRLVRLAELRALFDQLARYRTSMGALRRILAERAPGYVAPESELEARFIELVERFGLPTPMRQFAAPWLTPERGRVDFAYPEANVVVEVDGRRWHTRDEASRRDRWRDRQAQLAGWMVLRYGYDELTSSGEEVVTEIRRAFVRRAGTAPAA